MKKKWTYLAVAGMLLGTAPVFTGCVDNDEPAGIEQLRGAKAQLLQAKAEVEKAVAEIRKADAEYRLAQAQHERALAAQAEADAEWMQLRNELKAAKNEKEKLKLQKQMQELQYQMQENVLLYEKTLLVYQEQYEIAKRHYEIVMEQIKIAEAIGSESETISLSSLETAVKKAYAELYGGKWGENPGQEVPADISLYAKMIDAQQYVRDITMYQAQGYSNTSADAFIPYLEYRVAAAEAALEAEKEAKEKFDTFLEEDVLTADWRAEIASLETTLEEVYKNWNGAIAAVTQAKNSGSYLAASQKLYGIYKEGQSMNTPNMPSGVEGTVCLYPSNWDEAVEPGAWQNYQQANKDLNDLKFETEFTIPENLQEDALSDQLTTYLDAVEQNLYGSVTNFGWDKLGYNETKYKFYDTYTVGGNTYAKYTKFDLEEGEYPNQEIEDICTTFQYAISVLDEAAKDNAKNDAVEAMFKLYQAWVNDAYKKLTDQIAKDYADTFTDAEKAIADAEKALLAADAEMAKENDKIADAVVEEAKWYQTYNAYKNIKDALVQAVVNNLGIEWPNNNNPINSGNYNTEAFEDALKQASLDLQKEVMKAEDDLAEAKVELEAAKNDSYDELAYAEYALNVATRNFNDGVAAWEQAVEDLNTALAVIAADEEGGNAEQPGDGNEDPAGEEEQPAE